MRAKAYAWLMQAIDTGDYESLPGALAYWRKVLDGEVFIERQQKQVTRLMGER